MQSRLEKINDIAIVHTFLRSTVDHKAVRAYKRLARVFRTRKRILGINQGQYKRLTSRPCYFCGERFELSPLTGQYGLRRKNKKLGYWYENLSACCAACNKPSTRHTA